MFPKEKGKKKSTQQAITKIQFSKKILSEIEFSVMNRENPPRAEMLKKSKISKRKEKIKFGITKYNLGNILTMEYNSKKAK